MGSFIPNNKKVKELKIDLTTTLDETYVEELLYASSFNIGDLNLSVNKYIILGAFSDSLGDWRYPSAIKVNNDGKKYTYVVFISDFKDEHFTKLRVLPL